MGCSDAQRIGRKIGAGFHAHIAETRAEQRRREIVLAADRAFKPIRVRALSITSFSARWAASRKRGSGTGCNAPRESPAGVRSQSM